MLWVCRACGCRYAPDSPACPECGADDHFDQGSEEDEMAKISAAGGVTVAGVPGLDNQSDRDEDQWRAPEGGQLSTADRIEAAAVGQPVESAPASVTSDDAPEDYSEWTYAELQAECKERPGLSAVGSREELVARLIADDAKG